MIITAGQNQTVSIQEGQALNITGATGAVGVVYLLDPALGGTNSSWSRSIGAGDLAQIGPYSGDKKFLITCSVGSITALVRNAVLGAALASDVIPKYLGQVATSTYLPDTIHPSSTFSYNRNPHWARDDISSLQIVLPNWYTPQGGSSETNGAGVATWTAAIEYPVGVFTQVLFNGAASGTVAAGANLISDAVTVAIPNGAKFWTRIWQSAPGKIMYFALAYGDGTAESTYGTTIGAVPDKTMGGSGTVNTFTAGAAITPCAIIAQTSKKTIAIVGDSISIGRGDTGDLSLHQGYIARAFGGRYAYLHTGHSGDSMQSYIGSHAKRVALTQYASHIVFQLGINDVNNSRTAAQVLADTNTILGYFAGKPVAVCTLTPDTTSTDSWATAANQTVVAAEAVRLVVNAQRRNGLTSAAAVFDVERAAESSYLSGKWQSITGTISPASPGYTDDGIHANRTGYLAIAQTMNISSFV